MSDELEQLLLRINNYGEPMLWRARKGWHCKVEMFVQAQGAKVDIASNSDHETPTIAAKTCLDRIIAVVRDISKLADNKALSFDGEVEK